MQAFIRILRYLFAVTTALGFSAAAYFVWLAVADYQMQIREHWRFRCIDVQFMALLFAMGAAAICAGSFFAFRKITSKQHRLHGPSQI
jgi:hypothetical protein